MGDTQRLAEYPAMPLREVVIFPRAITSLLVARPASIAAIMAANSSALKQIFLVTQKDADTENPGADGLYPIGVVSRVLQVLTLPDGTVKALFEGLFRAAWKELHEGGAYLIAAVEKLPDIQTRPDEKNALMTVVRQSLEEYGKINTKLSQDMLLSILACREPGEMADALVPHLKASYQQKLQVLDALDVSDRLERAYELLEGEMDLTTVEKRIRNRVRMQMERNQRDYYLTEQIKAINKEMGRDDDPQVELAHLEGRLKSMDMPDEPRNKALAEVKKLRAMQPATSEYTVIRNYVDWVLDLPWNARKDINIDIEEAGRVLDSEHYGLEKAKERILEYLAVQKLSRGLKGPILCLAGPPGVGKTSLARSIANATGRDFIRLSMGGVRDEAEIRGHRRTYVGALPGKIIQSLKRVKFNNPLLCLDEIDKLASDYRGDPASALLEVLDPEQNSAFMDHYLDLEYDLSRIFFVTTANSLHTIPPPLLDRMEVIELSSYLETEKKHIAKDYLIPRQLEMHALKPHNLRISDKALYEIIRSYTRESGVRNLEREIAALCRKTAIKLVQKNDLDASVNITLTNLEKMLGVKKYRHEERESAPKVGVCAGLAYNQRGGEILFVETSIMSGNGQIVTTGQLGDVMKESARAALSWVRSRSAALGLDTKFYRNIDIHIHVPAGSTPKDGPSAGITLATSIASALLGIPVRNDVAMTGEISLRGRVLPIGGLREKLLAARRSGITRVLIPGDNAKDLGEVPQEILRELEIIYVDHVDEVLPLALTATKDEIFCGKGDAATLPALLRCALPEEAASRNAEVEHSSSC